ncbi:MAG: hypothetical protein ACREV1_11595, partial [Gammaproteobacteria bacterium]
MPTHTISDYSARRFALLKELEKLRKDAYVETQGIPTIGIGFYLRAHTDLILEALGFDLTGAGIQQLAAQEAANEPDPVKQQAILARAQQTVQDELNYIQQIRSVINASYAPNATSTLQRALDPIMQARANNADYPQGFTRSSTFAFQNDADAQPVFDALMAGYTRPDGSHEEGYEEKVDRWLTLNNITAIPTTQDSLERLALMSLAYNSKQYSSGLPKALGLKLTAALQNDDRAEAWFEIRYDTNSNSYLNGKLRTGPYYSDEHGIGNRRYKESDLFGLYESGDSTNLPEGEAKEIYRMVTRHRELIQDYEIRHAPTDANAGSQDIQFQLDTAYQDLLSDYGRGVAIAWDHIFVGEDASTVYFRGTDADTGQYALNGTVENDLIFGEDGNDILKGGLGDDVLYGGKGDDTYKFSPGDGADILIDEDGKGRIFIGDKELREATHQQGDPDNVYKTLDGHRLTLSGDTLTIAVKDDGGTISIQEFTSHPDRLGLQLNQDAPAYNASSVFQAIFDYVGKRALGLLEYVIPTAHAAPNQINATPDHSSPVYGTNGNDTLLGATGPGQTYALEAFYAGEG